MKIILLKKIHTLRFLNEKVIDIHCQNEAIRNNNWPRSMEHNSVGDEANTTKRVNHPQVIDVFQGKGNH